MSPLRESDRGLVILAAAVVTLAIVAVDARQHFATMSAGGAGAAARAGASAGPAATDAPPLSALKAVAAGARGQVDIVYAGGQALRPDAHGIALAAPAALSVEGWAVATTPPGALAGVLLSVDGGPPLRAEYGRERSDVAGALNCAGCAASGFVAAVDQAHMRPGSHRLVLRYVLPGGGTYVASAPLVVRIGR